MMMADDEDRERGNKPATPAVLYGNNTHTYSLTLLLFSVKEELSIYCIYNKILLEFRTGY